MCPCVPDWIGIWKCWFFNWTGFIAQNQSLVIVCTQAKKGCFVSPFFWGGGGLEVGIRVCFVRCLVSVFRHQFLNSFDSRVHWNQTLNCDRYNQCEWHNSSSPLERTGELSRDLVSFPWFPVHYIWRMIEIFSQRVSAQLISFSNLEDLKQNYSSCDLASRWGTISLQWVILEWFDISGANIFNPLQLLKAA